MRRLLFTGILSATIGTAAAASADRVILLPPSGTADQDTLDHVEEALVDAVRAVGHEPYSDPAGLRAGAAPLPETSNEMRAVADMHNARYVVVPRVTPLRGQYRLFLRVGYAPAPRVEEIEVNVTRADEAARLRDVLGAMLRPAGLGDDAVRLTEPVDEAAHAQVPQDAAEGAEEDAEAPAREQQAARAREEREARERRREEEALRREEEAWEGREKYGQGGPYLLQVAFDLRPIIAHRSVVVAGEERGGGVLVGASARLGRSIAALPGLELRAAVDMVGGASSGFGAGAGAVYLYSPFADVPLFIGAGIELGWFQFLTGNNVASFMVRASPVVAWRVADQLYLEAALPELMGLSANGGVATLGVSLRGGIRF